MAGALVLAVGVLTGVGCGSSQDEAPPKVDTQDATPPQVDIPNATLHEGVLIGGTPSPEDLQAASEAGYGSVISLQPLDEPGAREARDAARELGMTYTTLPVRGAEDVDAQTAAEFAQVLDRVMNDDEGHVMVHCASGNRVGALYALNAHHQGGLGPEEALQVGKAAGLTGLADVVRDELGLGVEE